MFFYEKIRKEISSSGRCDCDAHDYSGIWNVDALSDMWPKALAERINRPGVEALHIAFAKAPILDAINRFTVNGEHLTSGKNFYTRETYVNWGLVSN